MGLIILTLLGLKYLPGWVKLVWLFQQARSAENTSSIERQAHSALTVTRKDGTGMAFSAELRLAKETDAELLVYDTSGRLLSRTDMAGGTIKRADFTVPQTGVYVVKALTLEEEFTRKIMANY